MIEDLLEKELEFNFAFANYLFKREPYNAEDLEIINFLTKKLSFHCMGYDNDVN